jgi:hypothetical protein
MKGSVNGGCDALGSSISNEIPFHPLTQRLPILRSKTSVESSLCDLIFDAA